MKVAPDMPDPLEQQLEQLYDEAIDATSCPAEAFDIVNAQQKALIVSSKILYGLTV